MPPGGRLSADGERQGEGSCCLIYQLNLFFQYSHSEQTTGSSQKLCIWYLAALLRMQLQIPRYEIDSTTTMASNSILLNLISCKDLKAFNFFQKLSVYAVAVLGNGDGEKGNRKQLQKTPIDREGGGNPEWHHEVRFDLDEILSGGLNSLFIEIDLLCDGILVNKKVGEVRVPVSDFIGEFNGLMRFVSYQVRSTDGKPNGVLNLSYKANRHGKMPSTFPAPVVFSPQKPQAQESPQSVATPATTDTIEYIHPQDLTHAPVQITYSYPPPPGLVYYSPPATFCYPQPTATVYHKPPYGYSYSLTECPAVHRLEPADSWRRFGYPTLGQTESPMDNTLARGLYPTID